MIKTNIKFLDVAYTKISKMSLSYVLQKSLRIFTYLFLFCLSFVFLYPFLYMVITSIKTQADLTDMSVNWIPKSIKFENYKFAAQILKYPLYLKNSLFITLVSTIGHLVSCSFIGYGFARFKFPGRNLFFIIVVLSIVIPVQTIIVPLYMVYANLGWINTYLPLLLPTFLGFGLKGGLFVFIFRQFYHGLPISLEDAAQIDGCGFIKTYFKIALPVARSAIIVTIVLSVVWHWNDFYEAGIYLSKPKMLPLPSVLPSLLAIINDPEKQEILFNQVQNMDEIEKVINEAVLMAGTFITVLPVLVLYGFLQKKFVQGIERTGLVE